VLGEDHPDTLASANNFALDLSALGEHELARQLDADTLSRCRRVLGEDHPNTLIAGYNLTVNMRALGELEEDGLIEETLSRCRPVLDEDHPVLGHQELRPRPELTG